MELMYREIYTPYMDNINIPVPNEWKGMSIEVIAFPLVSDSNIAKQGTNQEKRKKRNELLDRYPIDLSDYNFNRDEANDYE